MSELTAITDRILRAIKTLPWQFQDQPVFLALVASYVEQAQDLEDVFMDLYLLRALATAEGEQLNRLGAIVGEPRGDRDDDNYRAAIYGRIALNRTHARIEDILLTMTLIFDADYRIIELPNAAFICRLLTAIDQTIDPETFDQALQRNKGGGINASFQYSTVNESNTFRWAVGDTRESTTTNGWANDAQTTGGLWSDVVG